jgi:hypothetical protein
MRHLLILAGAVGAFFLLARGTISLGPYTYDEPDYMYAASLGWRANAMDSPTMPLVDFVNLGMGRGRDAGAKIELSERVRDSGDVVFYRHWHGPLYSDWLGVVRQLTSNEGSARISNFVFPVAAVALMYFGALWLMPGAAGRAAAILCGVLYLWSYPVVRTTELGPHQLFAACIAAALLLLAKTFEAPRSRCRSYWYGAVVATALAFCLLEVAFALILTMLICGHLLRSRLEPGLGFAAKSIGLFGATVLIVWPGAVLKLSFIKAYLFMAYLAVFRRGAWGPGATIAGTWWLRFVESPIPWVVAAIGVVCFMRRRSEWRVLIPFAVFSLLMSAAIFPVKTEMARYTLPLWPGLVLFAAFSAGLALSGRRPVVRYGAVALIAVAMLATSWPSLRAGLPVRNFRGEAMLALIRDHGLAQKTLVVPHEDVPMLHYYFLGAHFKQYYDEGTILEQVRNGGVDGVIDRSDPPRLIPASAVP